MWFDQPIRGESIPSGTFALTFDDGPGVDTVEIARYLSEREIKACFFLVGKHLQKFPDAVNQLHDLGHTVGNHGYHHIHLTNSYSSPGELREEVKLADHLLRQSELRYEKLFFRAPYGAWSSRLAFLLNRDDHLRDDCTGPIGWDVGGDDWKFWEAGSSPGTCAASYLSQIQSNRMRKGIILCHDRSVDARSTSNQNRCLDMIRIFVPRLLQQNVEFCGIEMIPAVRRAAMEAPPRRK